MTNTCSLELIKIQSLMLVSNKKCNFENNSIIQLIFVPKNCKNVHLKAMVKCKT